MIWCLIKYMDIKDFILKLKVKLTLIIKILRNSDDLIWGIEIIVAALENPALLDRLDELDGSFR